jgi:riboflavin-specific deaminase-like protein
MRALFDVVLVGATTVLLDDPRLTTRLVPGDQPVRVVLDPHARVPHDRQVFCDGAAETLVVVGAEYAALHEALEPNVELLSFPLEEGQLPLTELLELLRVRGLSRVFVEGGGVTVSRFLEAGLLDRLQVAVAPTLIRAAPALDVPGLSPDLLQGNGARAFLLGSDVLFDCDLRTEGARGPS